MTPAFHSFRSSGWSLFVWIVFTVVILAACSVPNLEPAECTASREAVRRFYSFHIGNDMVPSAANLEMRAEFITAELHDQLLRKASVTRDYFTDSEEYPRAFSDGACSVVTAEKTVHDVLLLWKDDTTSRQNKVKVEAVKVGSNWLINRVFGE
ncbi:MAG: hypothetical protein WBD22_11930 [Pyrinomonadaceae bacterium]